MIFNDENQSSSKLSSVNKKDSHRKLKRLNRSIINLLNKSSKHSQIDISSHNHSTSNSSKSITFASVFDDQISFNRSECEDLIIVVPNKYVLNEPIVTNIENEPYPFRSEIPSYSLKSSSSMNLNQSEKKSFQYFVHPYRPKKLRHPINSIDRSTSTPNLFFSSPISITTDHHRSLKILRQWFNSSTFYRFFQLFTKQNSNKTIPSSSSVDFIY